MMQNRFVSWTVGCLLVLICGGAVASTIPTASTQAACKGFLTFPAWYNGLVKDKSSCELKSVGYENGQVDISTYIWTIVLNVIEIILQIIGYLAAIMIIYGGFLYLTSGGDPQGMSKALKTIINSSVGVAIALSAIAIKRFAWQLITGTGVDDFGIIKNNPTQVLSNGLGMAYFLVGVLSVLVIIVSGIRYIASGGSSDQTAKAKRNIIGGVAGLVVAIAATAITNFVVSYFQ